MKKLYKTLRMRQFNTKHAHDLERRALRWKARRRHRNRMAQGIPRKAPRVRSPPNLRRDYHAVVAPVQFSFLDNPEQVIAFIQRLEGHFSRSEKVRVVLHNVENCDYAAIVVLLAIMVRFRSHNIPFNGDFPRSKSARNLLISSGFFSTLYETCEVADRYHITEGESHSFHTHAWKNVDPVLSAGIITHASQQIWGAKRRCPGIQRVMLELMQNTNNHAEIGKIGEKHWWLSVHRPRDFHKVCFSFVDFGVGVFTSLNNKPIQSKFHNWAEKMRMRFTFGDNADLLRLILAGELHRTATGMTYRGKGLPGIANACRKNQISRLHLITNDVFCSYSEDCLRKLRTDFNGTLVYWEVTRKNENLPTDKP